MTPKTATAPAVWIGSLHAYNCGRLIGEWTQASDLDQLQETADRVLKRGGGEEIALMEFEGSKEIERCIRKRPPTSSTAFAPAS